MRGNVDMIPFPQCSFIPSFAFFIPSRYYVGMMNTYESALTDARKELGAAKLQQEAITLRIERLEAFIAHAAALIEPRSAPLFAAANVPVPLPVVEDASDGPLWKVLIMALNGKKPRFTVPEAVAALDRIGRKINSKNRGTIVRNAIKDKPLLFGRHGAGFYFVRGYESLPVNEELHKEKGNDAHAAIFQ